MEKILETDFLYSFYLVPDGTTIWVMEREGEIFLHGIFQMRKWTTSHWSSKETSLRPILDVLQFMGFREYPIYSRVKDMVLEEKEVLMGQFTIFENTIKQAAEAQAQRKQVGAAEAQQPEKPKDNKIELVKP